MSGNSIQDLIKDVEENNFIDKASINLLLDRAISYTSRIARNAQLSGRHNYDHLPQEVLSLQSIGRSKDGTFSELKENLLHVLKTI